MAHRQRGTPQRLRLRSRQPKTPDDQAKAGQRGQRIQAFPWHRADARDGPRTPAIREQAQRVHTQKKQQAQHQIVHREAPQSVKNFR